MLKANEKLNLAAHCIGFVIAYFAVVAVYLA
jgi:hypothetical protein